MACSIGDGREGSGSVRSLIFYLYRTKEDHNSTRNHHRPKKSTERDAYLSAQKGCIITQYSLMCRKLWGLHTASVSRCLYFMWLLKLQMRELNMQLSEYFLRNRLLRILMHFEYLYSVHSFLRSDIVFIVFLYSSMSAKKSQKGTFRSSQTLSTTSLYFSMKEMIAFPQFLGMFLVQFLTGLSGRMGSSTIYSWLASAQSSETPFCWVILQDFQLQVPVGKRTWGMMGWKQGMMELSFSSFLMSLSSMLLLSAADRPMRGSSLGKMSSILTSQSFPDCSGSLLLGSMEKLKKEEPSLGLIMMLMLLMLESRLSSLMMLLIQFIPQKLYDDSSLSL